MLAYTPKKKAEEEDERNETVVLYSIMFKKIVSFAENFGFICSFFFVWLKKGI